ncbi:hypothetical protein OPV22_004423 [Ensete ventricosum]|uniref:Golgi apparatus membrane protein TVP15 n=1 Tax=Ensete ventricosum TaxID=4639 RepID=A0AAV8S3S8_ENSVE|nr:hypothetical protein OPV22_004423 [Ensete ventricosum]
MARDAEAGEGSRPPPNIPTLRVRARPDPLLIVCRCFSFVTAVAAVACVSVNALFAVRSFRHGSDIFGGIFRCYAVAISLFVAVAETEWGFVIKIWRILEYWACRGMLQIFVAVMTRAFPVVSGEKRYLVLLQEISSYLLLACGLTYVISGALCIGFLKRSRQHQETTREQAARDLEEVMRRKEELEALLIVDRT